MNRQYTRRSVPSRPRASLQDTKACRFVTRPKLGYLLSQYPAVSHTFFFNEIRELRRLGFTLETASINRPVEPVDGFSEHERDEVKRTLYLKGENKLHLFGKIVQTLLLRPDVIWRGLKTVIEMNGWDVGASCYGLFYLAEAILLGVWLQDRDCTHLHVHFAGPVATVGMLASVAWQIPYSLTVHGPDELFNIDKLKLREKLRRAQFVICISDYCRSQMLRITAAEDWGKFHVCRLGVNSDAFAPEHVEGDVLRVVSVGRLHPSKGHLILLQAIAELKRMDVCITLDLVGGGSEREMLQSFVEKHNLVEQVVFHGPVSHTQTRALLRRADLFVLASFAEGVPVALMEAMAMEIPCVSTLVGGVPELIRSEIDGILVSPSSLPQLTSALFGLIKDPQKRRRLGASGRARVTELYNLQMNVSNLANTMSSCLQGFAE